jgi:hypothetical protein
VTAAKLSVPVLALAAAIAGILVVPSAARTGSSHTQRVAPRQLLANPTLKGLHGWWGRSARLVDVKGSNVTRVVVRRRTKGAGLASWPRVATTYPAGTRVSAAAKFRGQRRGGLVCVRVREFGKHGLIATTAQCSRASGAWKSVAVPYRLHAAASRLGVVVYRKTPRRGVAFAVKNVTLRVRTIASARRAASAAVPLTLGISANSSGWGSHSGVVDDRVKQLGLGWLREDFGRAGSGRVDTQHWDDMFSATASRGMRILPVLTDPADYQDTAFVAAAVARYGPGGTFWREHPSYDDNLAPAWWEVGNEPWWNKGQTPAQYARDFKAAVTAGRAANPSAKFLLAAFSAWKDPASGQWVSWVAPMFSAVPDLARYVDGWSDHPYCNGDAPSKWDPSSPSWIWQFQQFTKVHAELAAHGLGDAPMWLTEFGYATSGDRSVTEAQQAEYLAAAAHIASGYSYAKALFLYHLEDWGPRDGDREHWFGITHVDGTPKPAWTAVSELAASNV